MIHPATPSLFGGGRGVHREPRVYIENTHMQMHQLQPGEKKKRKRIGRGGKRGTYSGRGIKGQRARSGAKIRPEERDILKRIPKLRGYKFKSFRQGFVIVNIKDLQKKFSAGEEVSPATLVAKRLVRKNKGKTPRIKILGTGDFMKKVTFKQVTFSGGAQAKIAGVVGK